MRKKMIFQKVIEQKIFMIRGQKVILDADLAKLYDVTTKRLNEQGKRNRGRFPADFIFQLTKGEKSEVVANCNHLRRLKFSPVLPYAFTEHGAIMAASVLNTKRAIQVNVAIMRAFVRLRETLALHKEPAGRLSFFSNWKTKSEAFKNLASKDRTAEVQPSGLWDTFNLGKWYQKGFSVSENYAFNLRFQFETSSWGV